MRGKLGRGAINKEVEGKKAKITLETSEKGMRNLTVSYLKAPIMLAGQYLNIHK